MTESLICVEIRIEKNVMELNEWPFYILNCFRTCHEYLHEYFFGFQDLDMRINFIFVPFSRDIKVFSLFKWFYNPCYHACLIFGLFFCFVQFYSNSTLSLLPLLRLIHFHFDHISLDTFVWVFLLTRSKREYVNLKKLKGQVIVANLCKASKSVYFPQTFLQGTNKFIAIS